MSGASVTLDAQVILTWVTLVVAVVGAVVAVARWTVKAIRHAVAEATQQIQPDANGGASLPDVGRSVRALAESNDRQHQRLHQRIDGLGADVKDLQLWAADRPCLLDRHDRVDRARRRLADRQAPAECPDDDA